MPDVSLSVSQLDALELVRLGALPAWPLGAAQGTVTVPLSLDLDDGGGLTQVELVDLEGVPFVRTSLGRTSDGWVAQGTPTWLSARSSRPWETWHLGPDEVAGHTGLVALPHGGDPAAAQSALRELGDRPLLLVLVSLEGDAGADADALRTVRLAQELAAEHPGTRLAIAPVPHDFTAEQQRVVVESYAHGHPSVVVNSARPANGTDGMVVFFTGLSGSGKSTLARTLRNRLLEAGVRATLLDGDVVRRHLSAGLGFSEADRNTNIRRIGWVAAEISHHGGTAICCPIAPFEVTREEVRQMVEARGGRFLLIHVSTPLAECERRDRKGLYARARRGEIVDFTGISSPYEEPLNPDLRVDTTGRDVDELVAQVLAHMGTKQ